jgi:nucleotide-binding universal stress UspA family protein
VLGTRGLTGLRHLELGSTASAVAHEAMCSVLVACEAL